MKKLTNNERAVAALARLERFYDALCLYGKEDHISFDLGMLNQFNYYTGIIFRAYTHGTGDVIAAGGRYDSLVGQFGKQAPAIGVAVYSDQLLTALLRQGLLEHPAAEGVLIVYSVAGKKQAVEQAAAFRAVGRAVTLLADNNQSEEELKAYAEHIGAKDILHL